MKLRRHTSSYLLGALMIGLASPLAASAQNPASAPAAQIPALHDGQHDFDFELGHWKAHLRYLKSRLTGSNEWDDLDGTVVTTPFMEGKGNLTEIDVTSPVSHRRIQGIAVRLYDPTSHQWSIYGADPTSARFDPPQIGHFEGNRGFFYATDIYHNRAVLIRFEWQKLGPDKTHFEQAFSVDGGKTWEVNWIYDGTRLAETASH